ncbi:hypothetical protein [Flammeovirga aprica]|uniref:Terminase n=1 Tax=Flammeovirga aprica JL-4 TaxID=694437 RepID=A0A7X9RTG5_9BACT|nr:hypothetical protein [Flammeovirga aprica]NME67202.1 hypothetical protein [Flammeovirga aprica JL-4]
MYYNKPQLAIKFCNRKFKTFIAGRGTGKTTTEADEAENNIFSMPRSRGFIAGATYMQIFTLELPPIKAQWARMGYHEDIHYFIGKKPPAQWRKNWPKAYHMPSKLDNVIWWFNGSIISLISFDRKDTGSRGASFDWGIIIEAALFPKSRLDQELIPAMRPTDPSFRSNPRHESLFFASSMPWTAHGDWLFEAEEKQKEEEEAILGATLYQEWKKIKKEKSFQSKTAKRILQKLRQNTSKRSTLYLEANALDNLYILGENWIEKQRSIMQKDAFDIEIMNVRKKKTSNLFYPKFNDKRHVYIDSYDYYHFDRVGGDVDLLVNDCRVDGDIVNTIPLQISLDFNANIYSAVIFQELKSLNTVRFVKEFAVEEGKELSDLIQLITDYYTFFPTQHMKIWGDRNGNFKRKGSIISYYQEVMDELQKAGWTFELLAPEHNIPHTERFLKINKMLSGKDPRLPIIEINANNCKNFIISIKNAPTKITTGGIEKDKSSETSEEIKPVHATHYSDVFDYALWQFFGNIINDDGLGELEFGMT